MTAVQLPPGPVWAGGHGAASAAFLLASVAYSLLPTMNGYALETGTYRGSKDSKDKRCVRGWTLGVLGIFALSFIILGAIFVARYYAVTKTSSSSSSSAHGAASVTHLFGVREEDVFLNDDVNDQRFSGELRLQNDTAVIVGSTQGHCVATEVLGNGDIVQLCRQAYNFTGTGGILAGEIAATGRFLIPLDNVTFGSPVWAITGGTGAYRRAAGTITLSTAAGEVFYNNSFAVITPVEGPVAAAGAKATVSAVLAVLALPALLQW